MLRHLVMLVALVAVGCSAVEPPETTASAATTTDAGDAGTISTAGEPTPNVEAPATPVDECVAPEGAKAEDVDPEDEPEVPFAKVPGQKVTVFFQNSNASARYVDMVKTGAATWNQSPCFDLQVVAKCPADSNCVTVRSEKRSEDDDDTDGEFEGTDKKGVRRGGTLTVFTKLMDDETDNGALATIVHEMGHAIGLVHRKNPEDLMNADTDDDTNPMPDQVDFRNLLVIYGTR